MKRIFTLSLIFVSITFNILALSFQTPGKEIPMPNDVSQLTPNQEKYDVTFYSFDLRLLPDEIKITGSVTIYAYALETLDSLEFDYLSGNQVHSVYLAEDPGSALDYSYKSNMLTVRLDRSYNKTDLIKINVDFTSYSKYGMYNGSRTYNSGGQNSKFWFPSKDDFRDKADSCDLKMTVPVNFKVASNGLLKETSYTDTTATFLWQSRYPIASAYITYLAAQYEAHSNWYVRNNKDSMEILSFSLPGVYDKVKDLYALEKEMLAFFEDRFGPYPFFNEKYGHAEKATSNSYEMQTITAMNVFQLMEGNYEGTAAHELSHAWMANDVSCETYHHIWIVEGFATYASNLWYAFHHNLELSDIASGKEYFGSGTCFVEDPENDKIFDSDLSYLKASWVYHMLCHTVGDTVFFRTLKNIFSEQPHAYGTINTQEFKENFERESGLNLDKFFQQWIMEEYYPEYAYAWEYSEKDGEYELVLNLQQTQDWQVFWMPVDVSVQTADGIENFVVWDSLQTQTFYLPLSDKPQSVELDPDTWMIKKASNITGIEKTIDQLAFFTLSPNPASENVTIEFEKPGSYLVELISPTGQVVHKKEVDGNRHKLDLSTRPKGVFFIRIRSDEFVWTEMAMKR